MTGVLQRKDCSASSKNCDQLLTNSFPLRFFYIYLQRFILSGKIVVEIQFFCNITRLISLVMAVFYNEQYLSWKSLPHAI